MTEALRMGRSYGLGIPRAARLPPVFSEAQRAGNMLAMLSTNEYLDEVTIERVRASQEAPDGYIAGVGVGNIFHMLDLFPAGIKPHGIACTDVMPEVTLLGRVFVRNAARYDNLDEALDHSHGLDSIPSYLAVMKEERDPQIRKRFVQAVPYVVDWMRMRPDISSLRSHPGSGGEVIRTLRRNYATIHELAVAGKITVGYSSFIDEEWLQYVVTLPGWDKLRNVIYASNIVDHMGGRGKNMDEVNRLNETLAHLARTGSHWYVDTTDQSMEYRVRVERDPPQYSAADFTFGH